MDFAPFTLQSPAKLNLRLYIQKKRTDGYHNLSLDFIPIDLFDSLSFSPATKLRVECNLPIPPQDNLVFKAVQALGQASGKRLALRIHLNKQIPHGAGLGGGSGNAAAILLTLRRLFQLKLTPDELKKTALSLGADVPFFLAPRPSIATGIGEILTPLTLPQTLYFILLKPKLSISTKEAYAQALHSKQKLTPKAFSLEELARITPESNDFFAPLAASHKELRQGSESLRALSPNAFGFSGSGSCCFALFFEQKKRDQAVKQLGPLEECRIFAVQSLDHFDYHPTPLTDQA